MTFDLIEDSVRGVSDCFFEMESDYTEQAISWPLGSSGLAFYGACFQLYFHPQHRI